MAILELNNVSKRYGDLTVLESLDLILEAEKTYVLIGPSGCGKSTLLKLTIGLVSSDTGSVRIAGEELADANVLRLRQRIGYVIQDGGLFPHLSAHDNIALMARHLGWARARIDARIAELGGIETDLMDARREKVDVASRSEERFRALEAQRDGLSEDLSAAQGHLQELASLPVELTDDLETVAYSDFGGTLPAGFTAHPKRDPDTGELHAAVYSWQWNHIQYVVVGTDGKVRKTVDVPTPGSPMVHDCGITQDYFILLDLPVVFKPEEMALPYLWDEGYGARVGLLPREGNAEDVVWSEVDPCYVFHPMNAYQDSDGREEFFHRLNITQNASREEGPVREIQA